MSRAPWYAVAAVALATVATACTSSPSSSSSITTSPTVPASAVYFKTVSHPELGFRAMFPLIRGGDSVETTSGCDTGCSVGHDTNRVDVSSFVMPAGRGRYCLRFYSGRAGDACSRNYHLAQYAVSVDPEPPGYRSLPIKRIARRAYTCVSLTPTTMAGLPAVQCRFSDPTYTAYIFQHSNRLYVVTVPAKGAFADRFRRSVRAIRVRTG
jgi:hypothetical protein